MKGDFKKRGEAYMKKDVASQKRHGVSRVQQMVFPERNSVPISAKFALWILRRNNARIVDALQDNQKED